MTFTSLPTSTETFSNAEIVASKGTAGVTATNHAPKFNVIGDGKVTITLPGQAASLALQDDGRIVVTGDEAGNGFSLARINVDGTFDTTFSGDGKQIVQVGSSGTYGRSIVIQDDGKILTAGSSDYPTSAALTRYTANGALDSSFSADGKVTTNLVLSGTSSAQDIALQADGKILVAGAAVNLQGQRYLALARYDSQGNFDNSFSGDGKLTTDFGTNIRGIHSVAIQRDGKIVLAGTVDAGGRATGFDFALARYNSNGTLDTTFDGGGKKTLDFGYTNDLGRDMLIQPDDKILVVGQSYGSGQIKIALARFNSNGTPDASFSDDGRVTTQLGPYNNPSLVPNVEKFSVALQTDGKILIAGFSFNNNPDGELEFVLIRYNPDGTLDNSFSGDGILSTKFDGYVMAAGSSVAVQSNGQIVVAGVVHDGMQFSVGLVQYNEDGSLDSNFGIHNNLGGNPDYAEDGVPVILDSTVKISDTELDARGNYAGAVISLSRQDAANPNDTFSGSGNLSLADNSAVVSGVSIGSVVNAGGTLTITFNSNATPADVNETLSSIAYSNSSNSPPGIVQIDWVFSDGNVGDQGEGGELFGFGSTVVSISGVNDTPTGSVTIAGIATQGQIVSAVNTIVDLDGLGEISYQWLANGTIITDATSNTFLITQDQVGQQISVRASYTDLQGTAESVVSDPLKINTPPVASDNIYTIAEDDTLVLGNLISDGWAPGSPDQTLFHDTDADGDNLSISAITVSGVFTAWADLPNSTDPADLADAQSGIEWKVIALPNGTAWLQATGELRYAGKPNDTLGDTLSYTITDGQGGTAIAQVQIKVLHVDDPASATLSISGSAKTGGFLSLNVSNITDPDGTPSLAYQWQWLSDQRWQDIEGATNDTWAIPTGGLWADRAVRAKLSTTDPLSGSSVFHSDAQTIEASSQLVLSSTHWKSDKALQGVGVGLFDDATEFKTGSDGTLNAKGFQDPDGVDDGLTVINPTLAADPKQASITLTDVLGALKVYLGKPLPDAYNNDLKYIAADFDGNGSVNLSDVLGLLKFYLNKPVNAAPAWVFVDSAQTTTVDGQMLHWSSKVNQTLSTTASAPASILADLNSDEPVKLVGVLRGDVDGSWVQSVS